ncbi:hypothetical protein BJX64DRAFT_174537, partial [Aspergillus heterothallicus]
MSETGSLHKVRSRRSHRKSRLGCANCKKRRVKCDEKKPTCSNCLQHSIDCDFGTRSGSEASTPPARRYQFRQSKYQQTASPSPQSLVQSQDEPFPHTTTSIATQCDIPPTPDNGGGISLADLHLFHHFTTTTCTTLADPSSPSTRHLWQSVIPSWGITFPSILHLILTLSALHLASLHPSAPTKYTAQADQHFTFGVRSVTAVLALDTLDSANCQLIYISAVLICFAYFARGPRAGEFLVFSAAGKSEWLVLLHGVRTILEQKQAEIFTGALEPDTSKEPKRHTQQPGPDHDDDDDDDDDDEEEEWVRRLDDELARHLDHLHSIRTLITSQIATPDRDNYLETLDVLGTCFRDAYAIRKAGDFEIDLMPYVMGWTFRLPAVIIERLEAHEPVALVILAHWAILLTYMRGVWFMRGWDAHIVSGVRGCLAEGFEPWVEWPKGVVSS